MTQSRSELELLREWVLEALDHLWCPVLPVKELKPYLEALHHQAIPPDMFPRLLQAERQAFDQNNDRAVWLGLGIRPDLQGEPNRWVRSDWPVWVRVVDPQGERVRAYWLLRQLYRAPVAPDAPGSTGLTGLWVQLSQQLPAREVDQMRGVPPGQAGDPTEWLRSRFEIWGEVADQLYVDHAAEDRERRQRLAERVASMDLATQLYGSGHPT